MVGVLVNDLGLEPSELQEILEGAHALEAEALLELGNINEAAAIYAMIGDSEGSALCRSQSQPRTPQDELEIRATLATGENNSEELSAVARVLYERHRYDRAYSLYRRANDIEGMTACARMFAHERLWEEAVCAARAVDDPAISSEVADALLTGGKLTQAMALFRAAGDEDGEHACVQYLCVAERYGEAAEILYRHGRIAELKKLGRDLLSRERRALAGYCFQLAACYESTDTNDEFVS